MKRILIGHRGVGKSSLVQRLGIYQNLYADSIAAYDLDREIEKMVGASIGEIFSMTGEIAFRQMEEKTMDMLLRQKNFLIALGAGFPIVKFLPRLQELKDVEIIWVRRTSDQWGRIFLDRPRLNPEVPALEEFHLRFQKRSEAYEKAAHWIYDLPEGQSFPSEIERDIFSGNINGLGGGLSILPRHARNYENFKAREWRWDFDFFELRDDLLTDEELEKFFVLLAKDQVLISFRKETSSDLFFDALEEGYKCDWPLELGLKAPQGIKVLSLHEREPQESLASAIVRLDAAAQTLGNSLELKLAVEIHNFSELEMGLRWQGLEPTRRNFLPRSKDGRWAWARRWLKDRQLLNFVREGDGSALDQPSLSQWMSSPANPTEFAAILGSPVSHSYSPAEHQDFFLQHDWPIFPIEISEEEWMIAMPLLVKLGLRAAAVTAPLKKVAHHFCELKSNMAGSLGSVNTLWRKPHENTNVWIGDNTDILGFQLLLESIHFSESQKKDTVIWGGGGTLPVIKASLPEAQAYSIRTAQPREGSQELQNPKVLIWAGSPQANKPPEMWKPEIVIDLNYRDDSLAKEYGQQVGARYISGLSMFKAQAQAQQDIWQSELWNEDSQVGKGNHERE